MSGLAGKRFAEGQRESPLPETSDGSLEIVGVLIRPNKYGQGFPHIPLDSFVESGEGFINQAFFQITGMQGRVLLRRQRLGKQRKQNEKGV